MEINLLYCKFQLCSSEFNGMSMLLSSKWEKLFVFSWPVRERIINQLHQESHPNVFQKATATENYLHVYATKSSSEGNCVWQSSPESQSLVKKNPLGSSPSLLCIATAPLTTSPVPKYMDISATFLSVMWPDWEEVTEQLRCIWLRSQRLNCWTFSLWLPGEFICVLKGCAGKLARRN